jgi:hypothetical protein
MLQLDVQSLCSVNLISVACDNQFHHRNAQSIYGTVRLWGIVAVQFSAKFQSSHFHWRSFSLSFASVVQWCQETACYLFLLHCACLMTHPTVWQPTEIDMCDYISGVYLHLGIYLLRKHWLINRKFRVLTAYRNFAHKFLFWPRHIWYFTTKSKNSTV